MKIMLTFMLAAAAWSQQIDLTPLDRLQSKARESSVVQLDADKLKMAGEFLSADNAKEQKTKDLVSGLRGVFVRHFEFAKAGAFTKDDLEPIRKQLRAPGWSKVIEHKEEDGTHEIHYFKGALTGGMTIISAEQNELTVVNIVGPVDLSALGHLGNIVGVVPKIESGFTSGIEKKKDE